MQTPLAIHPRGSGQNGQAKRPKNDPKLDYYWPLKGKDSFYIGAFQEINAKGRIVLRNAAGKTLNLDPAMLTDHCVSYANNLAGVEVTASDTDNNGKPEPVMEPWTSSEGKTIQAKFLSLANGQVSLELANGRTATLPLVAALLASAAPLAAQTAPIVLPGAPGEQPRTLTAAEATELSDTNYSPADVAFMQGMIVHHRQAVDMAQLVPERTNNDAVTKIAERILATQRDEMDFMTTWLSDRGEPTAMPQRRYVHINPDDRSLSIETDEAPSPGTAEVLVRVEDRGTGSGWAPSRARSPRRN